MDDQAKATGIYDIRINFRDAGRDPIWIRGDMAFEGAYGIWDSLSRPGVLDPRTVGSVDMVRIRENAPPELNRRYGFTDPSAPPPYFPI